MHRTFRQVATAISALVLLSVFSSSSAGAFSCSSTFSRVPSQNVGKNFNSFEGVDAINETQAWAAGESRAKSDGRELSLLERYSKSAWKVVPSLSGAKGSTDLTGVSVVSNRLVFASGVNFHGATAKPVVERWTPSGGAKMMKLPSFPANSYVSLEDIDSLSASDVWTVGYDKSGGLYSEVVLHWNGAHWQSQIVPAPSTTKNELFGVTAISATDVWAVGAFENSSNVLRNMTLHFNGAIWSAVAAPNFGTNDNELESVSGIGSSDVWAVGWANVSSGVYSTVAMHWTGGGWAIVPTTNPGTGNFLNDVSMASTGDVYAVGSHDGQTLMERWNGASWSTVVTPNPGSQYDALSSMVALSSGFYWAAGDEGSPFHTLVLVACV